MIEACPVCTATLPNKSKSCNRCGSDLGLLYDFDNLAVRFYNEALALVNVGNRSEAAARLRAAIGVDHAHTPSWIVLGKLLAQQGQHQEALLAFQTVLKIGVTDPTDVEKAGNAIARIGEILKQEGRKEERSLLDERNRVLSARRRTRWRTVALTTGAAVGAAVLTTFVNSLPPSPASAAAAARLAFENSPTTRTLQLTAKESGAAVAIAGQVPGYALRELAELLAQNALRGRRMDASGLLVSDARIATELKQVLAALPGILGVRASSASQDLLAAIAAARIEVVPGSGDSVRLAGTVPLAEAKTLISALAASIAGARPIDDTGIRIDDSYVVYVVRSGDAPESIARRLCGSARRIGAIRSFSRENAEALAHMRVGSELRIPKRLLTPHSRAVEDKKG